MSGEIRDSTERPLGQYIGIECQLMAMFYLNQTINLQNESRTQDSSNVDMMIH
jgi:hypothetical protein